MILLLGLFHALFALYFVYVGVWRLAFLPISGLTILILARSQISTQERFTQQQLTGLLSRYAFAIAWCCMMLGGRGVADIYAVDPYLVGFWLILLNMVLWLGAYAMSYQEGKQMFHIGYYVASLGTLLSLRTVVSLTELIQLSVSWIAVTMALYGFIVFVIGAFKQDIGREMTLPLFVTIHLNAIYLIYHYANADLYLATVLAQIYLMIVYCLIYAIRYYTADEEQIDDTLFRRILAGKSLKQAKPKVTWFKLDIILDAHRFLGNLDSTTKFAVSLFNIILIVVQILVFLTGYGTYTVVMSELLLWFGIIAFFINYLLLRTIDFYYTMQRVLAFVLINFGIYVSIYNIFGNDVVYLMMFGMLWSVLNSLAIFHAKYFSQQGVLEYHDYYYRIGTNLLATLVNLYFVFFLPVSSQLRFSIGAIYFGMQFFLLLYNMRYVQQTLSE